MNDTAAAPILRRIWRLFLPHRTKLVIVAVAIVVSSVLGMVTPFLTRAVFDRALFPPAASWTSGCWWCCAPRWS